MKILSFAVCQDCLCWIANADDSGLDILPESEADSIRESRDDGMRLYEMKGYHFVANGEDLGFCGSPCEICDALPGDRYRCHALKQET
jgi:hypothetical protein